MIKLYITTSIILFSILIGYLLFSWIRNIVIRNNNRRKFDKYIKHHKTHLKY